MKRAEKHLQRALEVAARLQPSAEVRVLDEKLKSDISSFGTAVLHSGLLPGIALFSDSSTNSGKRRVQLLNAVYLVLETDASLPNRGQISKTETLLLRKAMDCPPAENDRLRNAVMDAAIALKLALRTFELKSISDD